jgi:hypothetical protein
MGSLPDSNRTNESHVSHVRPGNARFSRANVNAVDKKKEKLDLRKELHR